MHGRAAHWSADWASVSLGTLRLQLLAGKQHPLLGGAASQPGQSFTSTQVLAHDFVSPARSLFCGKQRGKHSDGWRDDQFPRRIAYWIDDLQLLLAMVRSGKALAYLPDFALDDADLVRLEVTDCGFQCMEEVHLVWNTRNAAQWQRAVVRALTGEN
ncbi:hypothetical protein UNDYM_0665 [Undibacterium sp. YM2]|uniref:LysR substrate-binding domain-containing protein n=1 Tax=Undibacterium sp. YM2 TaxID=2058625 RepID=UPI001331D51E|nr:LysR substrate-binding domain-containing protein [Undibacterium sp. YM2]BBB64918.1 hypothetical protein UNDYM_0665 [Undibacterium sp. YM2]